MRYYVIFLLCCALQACKPSATPIVQTQAPVALPSTAEFLREAILQGLKQEGFPKETAMVMLENGHRLFVGKCQICGPVKTGINAYISSYKPTNSTADPKILEGLRHADVLQQQQALKLLVEKYVAMHYERLGLNTDQKSEMESQLSAARKFGMSIKPASFGTFCPSCDGACEIK